MESVLFSSRWLLAPIYLGLGLGLLALGIKFYQEVFHLLPKLLVVDESELVLTVLGLIDLALVGSLLVMVMFSGYENFVSRIDVKDASDQLTWLGKLDAGALKIRVAASIVAISSIHLLRKFMEAEQSPMTSCCGS